MGSLLAWLQSFGGTGATANAASMLDDRRREEWIVDGLVLRLERRTHPGLIQPTTTKAAVG
jgi:hypothetical protein